MKKFSGALLFATAMLGSTLAFAQQREDGRTNGDPANRATVDSRSGEGNVCGGIAGKRCPDEKQYCDFGVGQCKIADAQGTCKTKPRNCTREFRPVCGCDGKTYGNACTAAAAGVSIEHEGECKTE